MAIYKYTFLLKQFLKTTVIGVFFNVYTNTGILVFSIPVVSLIHYAKFKVYVVTSS